MTAPPPLLPALDRRATRWERLVDTASPQRMRMLGWLVPALVTVLAAVLRLVNLAHPHEIMFDETYYVKDAWSLWQLGYEGRWGDDANDQLARGDASALATTGSYVVHPPLGKWIIGLGMVALGPGSSLGWRITTALLGSLTVLVVYLIALRLTRSRTVATVAGSLLAVDGLSIVLSRTALLDGILTFFIVLGFLFALLDRQHAPARLASLIAARRRRADAAGAPAPLIGPVLWGRPWLIAAGFALGAAAAVKWSGLYALAVLGLWTVVSDALVRRRAGVVLWPTDAVLRQGPASFLLLVGPALAVYLLSWTGWLTTSGGYDRGADPNPLLALWEYHASMLGFHVGLSSSHPYASPAWQWPLLVRPTAIWVGDDPTGCGVDHCIAVISSVPNPLIWYGGVVATLYLLYRVVRALLRRAAPEPAHTLPLVGLLGTYVPWLLFPDRTIFQFYTVVMMPFLVIALAVALRDLAGRRARGDAEGDPLHRRRAGQSTVTVLLIAVVLVSAFFYPVWVGVSVPYDFWLIHIWLPTWV